MKRLRLAVFAIAAAASIALALGAITPQAEAINWWPCGASGASSTATPGINTTVSHGAPGAASTTIAVPSGTKAGDRLFLATDTSGNCNNNTLPAWTNMVQMANSGNGGIQPTNGFQENILGGFFGAFTKVATAADASSGTYVLANCSTIFHYVMVDITRSDGITPNIDQYLMAVNSASANQTGPSLTTMAAKELVLSVLDHTVDNVQCTTTNNTNLFNGGATESLAASYTTVGSLGGSSTAATFTCGSSQAVMIWTLGFF